MHGAQVTDGIGHSGNYQVLNVAPFYKVTDSDFSGATSLVDVNNPTTAGDATVDALDLNKNDPYIDLMVTSTFESEIEIDSVTSCSPWFNVEFNRDRISDISRSQTTVRRTVKGVPKEQGERAQDGDVHDR